MNDFSINLVYLISNFFFLIKIFYFYSRTFCLLPIRTFYIIFFIEKIWCYFLIKIVIGLLALAVTEQSPFLLVTITNIQFIFYVIIPGLTYKNNLASKPLASRKPRLEVLGQKTTSPNKSGED